MSRPSNRKNSFQGQSVRRLPRSEFDDNTMRDLNRYDNRLDHNLRNVEKAKEVMMRSLEKDMNIFKKGGIRSNKKYTVAIQNPGDSRQRRDSTTSQPNKYQSDTRNKKPVGHSGQTSTQQPKTVAGNDVTTAAEVGYHSSASSGGKPNREHNESRDILTETRDVIDKQKKGDVMMEEFMLNHPGVEGSLAGDKHKRYYHPTTGTDYTDSGIPDSRNSHHLSHGYDSSGYNSATPTIRVDDYHPSMTEMGDHGQVNGRFPFYDDLSSYGPNRRPQFWERMSTPKNPSRNLQKREQLVREFSSPALKSGATTPAAPKSAKGSRTLIVGSSSTGPSGATASLIHTTTSVGKSGTRKKSPVPGAKAKPKSSSPLK